MNTRTLKDPKYESGLLVVGKDVTEELSDEAVIMAVERVAARRIEP